MNCPKCTREMWDYGDSQYCRWCDQYYELIEEELTEEVKMMIDNAMQQVAEGKVISIKELRKRLRERRKNDS